MNRRGMALLLVLWLIVLLTGMVGLGLGRTRRTHLHALNRLAELRAGWAREACLEVVLGRARSDSSTLGDPVARLPIDSLDLGEGVWCSARLSDPGEKVHLNLASHEMLARLFRDSLLAMQAIAARPWPSIQALPPVFLPWTHRLTVRGSGRINLLRADEEVLAVLPGLGEEGAREIVRVRQGIGPLATLEEVLGRVSSGTRDRVLSRYDRFSGAAGVRTDVVIAEVTGSAPQRPVQSRMTVTLIPAGTRLAVVRREVE